MTNREILIKLAEGTRFTRPGLGDTTIYMDEAGATVYSSGGRADVSAYTTWQEVVEPRRWEYPSIRVERCCCWPANLCLPEIWEGKRVKVTVEEII